MRLWDAVEKEMIYFTFESLLRNSFPIINSDSHVMRYLGIKDVISERIYEGDIVRAMYVDESFFWFGSVQEVMYCYNSASYAPVSDMLLENALIELMGNIYENPELLEKK